MRAWAQVPTAIGASHVWAPAKSLEIDGCKSRGESVSRASGGLSRVLRGPSLVSERRSGDREMDLRSMPAWKAPIAVVSGLDELGGLEGLGNF